MPLRPNLTHGRRAFNDRELDAFCLRDPRAFIPTRGRASWYANGVSRAQLHMIGYQQML
jgi:hypothetical protein